MSCKRSDAFLEGRGITVRETVDARKQRFAAKDLEQLFAGARSLTVARGKKSQRIDLAKAAPTAAEFAKLVLGPSGNLRAPTAQVGKDWIVGFGEEAWVEFFG